MKINLEDAWFAIGVKENEFDLPDHWSDYEYIQYIKDYLNERVQFSWKKENES